MHEVTTGRLPTEAGHRSLVVVPRWAINSLYMGDESGLTDDEQKMCNEFERDYCVIEVNEPVDFCTEYELAFGPACEGIEVLVERVE